MPKGKNCPNCGAPYDPALNKCPFCGTIYFDMSCLDISSHEPIYLKLRVQLRGDDGRHHACAITQKCIPMLSEASMEMSNDCTYCTNIFGRDMRAVTSGLTLETHLNFRAVPDANGSLCNVEIMEGATDNEYGDIIGESVVCYA